MEIRFIGPLGKVTGSATWMRDESRGWSFLIDCGMQQGEHSATAWNSCLDWPFDPSKLDFVVLTHAHIDHSGLLPALYKRGFTGMVYCTEETRELAKVLLRDAAIFPGTPYSAKDIEAIKWHTPGGQTVFGGYHPVAKDLFLRFFRSGHIIGAVSVTVLWGPNDASQKSIVFSGDVGPGTEGSEVLPFLRYPLHPKPGNFVVLESTYGDTIRNAIGKRPESRRGQLRSLLDRIVESKGTLAIPAFSVGRTQDLLFDINFLIAESPKQYGDIEFYIDSPTALQVNEITLNALRKTGVTNNGKVRPLWLGKQLFRDLGLDPRNRDHIDAALDICEMALQFEYPKRALPRFGNAIALNWRPIFTKVKERPALLSGPANKARVILMSSGTGDGGAAASWLPGILRKKGSIVAMSGHCGPTTVGGKLMSLIAIPDDQRALHTGELVWTKNDGTVIHQLPINKIEADISFLQGYSAHGDQDDLLNWLFEIHKGETKQVIGATVFLQHGEEHQRAGLEVAIQKRAQAWGLNVDLAKPDDPDQWFDLENKGIPVQRCKRKADLLVQMAKLEQELAML